MMSMPTNAIAAATLGAHFPTSPGGCPISFSLSSSSPPFLALSVLRRRRRFIRPLDPPSVVSAPRKKKRKRGALQCYNVRSRCEEGRKELSSVVVVVGEVSSSYSYTIPVWSIFRQISKYVVKYICKDKNKSFANEGYCVMFFLGESRTSPAGGAP